MVLAEHPRGMVRMPGGHVADRPRLRPTRSSGAAIHLADDATVHALLAQGKSTTWSRFIARHAQRDPGARGGRPSGVGGHRALLGESGGVGTSLICALRRYSEWLGELRECRHAVLLNPDVSCDGEPFGAGALARPLRPWPAGRGFLLRAGQAISLQVAR